MMVPVLSWVFLIFSASICLFAPTIVAVILIVKYKASLRAFLLGASAFIVAQPLLRMPILAHLQNTAAYTLFARTHVALTIVLIALSAGIFEETSRLIGLRLFLKNSLTWKNGVVFGLGHGGAEAFLLVGLGYVKTLVHLWSGQNIAALAQTPSDLFLAGSLGRILAVIVHIGMTLLVLYAVKYKKLSYFVYAVAFHTVLDSMVPLLKHMGLHLNAWIDEGIVGIFAAIAMMIVVVMKSLLNESEKENEQ